MHWSSTISIIINLMKICYSKDWIDRFFKVRIDKHRKWFMQRWFVCIKTNFETWMWKQFIVWGMGTLWWHWQVVYQLLVTYNENFGKKYLWFLQVLQFVETIFQNKCYQEPFMSFNETRNFECFDVRSLCDIKVEKMDWRWCLKCGTTWIFFSKSCFLD
jgi:hypothetical protein